MPQWFKRKAPLPPWQSVAHALEAGEKRIDWIAADMRERGYFNPATLYLTDQRLLWAVQLPSGERRVVDQHRLDRFQAILRPGPRWVAFEYRTGNDLETVHVKIARDVMPDRVRLFVVTLMKARTAAHARRGEDLG